MRLRLLGYGHSPKRVVMRAAAGVFVGLVLAGSLFTACGGDEPEVDTGTSTQTSDTPSGHEGSEHGEPSPVPEGARHIAVTARSSAFEPAQITVEAGEPVAIVLTSEGALHDFVIDDIETHVSADEGETAVGGLRADQPGRYTYYCSIPGHREAGMEGTLVVEATQ